MHQQPWRVLLACVRVSYGVLTDEPVNRLSISDNCRVYCSASKSGRIPLFIWLQVSNETHNALSKQSDCVGKFVSVNKPSTMIWFTEIHHLRPACIEPIISLLQFPTLRFICSLLHTYLINTNKYTMCVYFVYVYMYI